MGKTRNDMQYHADKFSKRREGSGLLDRYRSDTEKWKAQDDTQEILKHAFHVAASWLFVSFCLLFEAFETSHSEFDLRCFPNFDRWPTKVRREAWFAFACDESQLPVVQELAELLTKMLNLCKKQTITPRLRVALQAWVCFPGDLCSFPHLNPYKPILNAERRSFSFHLFKALDLGMLWPKFCRKANRRW